MMALGTWAKLSLYKLFTPVCDWPEEVWQCRKSPLCSNVPPEPQQNTGRQAAGVLHRSCSYSQVNCLGPLLYRWAIARCSDWLGTTIADSAGDLTIPLPQTDTGAAAAAFACRGNFQPVEIVAPGSFTSVIL